MFGYDYLIVIVSDEWLVLMIMYNVFAELIIYIGIRLIAKLLILWMILIWI